MKKQTVSLAELRKEFALKKTQIAKDAAMLKRPYFDTMAARINAVLDNTLDKDKDDAWAYFSFNRLSVYVNVKQLDSLKEDRLVRLLAGLEWIGEASANSEDYPDSRKREFSYRYSHEEADAYMQVYVEVSAYLSETPTDCRIEVVREWTEEVTRTEKRIVCD